MIECMAMRGSVTVGTTALAAWMQAFGAWVGYISTLSLSTSTDTCNICLTDTLLSSGHLEGYRLLQTQPSDIDIIASPTVGSEYHMEL